MFGLTTEKEDLAHDRTTSSICDVDSNIIINGKLLRPCDVKPRDCDDSQNSFEALNSKTTTSTNTIIESTDAIKVARKKYYGRKIRRRDRLNKKVFQRRARTGRGVVQAVKDHAKLTYKRMPCWEKGITTSNSFQSPTSTTSSSTYHECGRQIKKLQSSSSASSCSSSFTCLRPCFGVSRDQTRPKSSQNYNKIQSEALIRPSGASRTRKSILKQTTHRLPDGFTSNQSICNSSQHPSQITSCESDNTNYSQRYTQSENAISSDHTSVACEFDRPEFTKPLNPPSIKKNRDTEMCNHSNKTKKRKNSLHCKSPQQRSVESGDSNYLLKSRKRQNYCPKPSTKCLFSSSSCKDALAGGIAGSSICNYFSQSLSSSTQCDSLEQQFAESSTASQSCSFETCPLPFPKVASKCPFSSESCSSCENLSAGCESMSSACEFPFTPCKPSISAPCVDQSTQCSDAADQYANTNTSSFSSQTCTTDDTSYLPCKKITSFRQPRLCSRRKCCPPKSCSPVNDCSFFPCRRKPEEIRKLVKALKMEKKMEAIKSCRRKMCLQEMRRRRNKARELARRIRPKDKKFYCLW